MLINHLRITHAAIIICNEEFNHVENSVTSLIRFYLSSNFLFNLHNYVRVETFVFHNQIFWMYHFFIKLCNLYVSTRTCIYFNVHMRIYMRECARVYICIFRSRNGFRCTFNFSLIKTFSLMSIIFHSHFVMQCSFSGVTVYTWSETCNRLMKIGICETEKFHHSGDRYSTKFTSHEFFLLYWN